MEIFPFPAPRHARTHTDTLLHEAKMKQKIPFRALLIASKWDFLLHLAVNAQKGRLHIETSICKRRLYRSAIGRNVHRLAKVDAKQNADTIFSSPSA